MVGPSIPEYVMKKAFWFVAAGLLLLQFSCSQDSRLGRKMGKWLNYREFLGSVKECNAVTTLSDSSNLFDQDEYNPFRDSLSKLMAELDQQLQQDSLAILRYGQVDTSLLTKAWQTNDTLSLTRDTFTNEVSTIQASEIAALRFNLDQVRRSDSAGRLKHHAGCRQKECRLWANVDKSRQRLFLYLDGYLVDSFKVSSGKGEFETPNFDVRPSGPMFRKYTSRKFPGGNYMGLGNMPYAVFFNGGFAIHGTTAGNIPRLGNKASHGCIRLHPDNARLFFELVNTIGLHDTWVTVKD